MRLKPVPPSAGIDRFVIGFTGASPAPSVQDTIVSNKSLRGEGRISTPKSKRMAGYQQITLNLTAEDGQNAGELRIDLHWLHQGDELTFTDRCSISGNGMTMMRGVLGHATCGGLSFNGKPNVLGRRHAKLDGIKRQLPVLVDAVEFAADFLTAAFPGWKPGEIWLKEAEACRDLPINDAIAGVRVIQHSTLWGAVRRLTDEYRRIGGEEERGVPAIRFIQHAIGPEDKIYAKRDDLLRLEVVCSRRPDVVNLTGVRREGFDSDGVHALFLNFITLATPRLDRLEQHARDALAGEAAISSLIISLKPVIDRAAGTKKVKGPASDQASSTATRLLDALLSVGVCDVAGTHARHAIRRDLDALCANDGPLLRHPKRAIYYLKPQFARACSALRSSSSTSATVQL